MTEEKQYPIIEPFKDGVKTVETQPTIEFYVRGNIPGEEILAVTVNKPFRAVRYLAEKGWYRVVVPARLVYEHGVTRDPRIVEDTAQAMLIAAATARGLNLRVEIEQAEAGS